MANTCDCGSGKLAEHCCNPLLSGLSSATSAEALMRSRYAAYVQCNRGYLLKTWHPSTRPLDLVMEGPESLQWLGLEIINSSENRVEFIARYHADGKQQKLHEVSEFVCEQGQWLYIKGRHKDREGILEKAQKPGRNTLCTCGSGKKYKRCCGK